MANRTFDVGKALWLVCSTEYFFDGHGEESSGASDYFITNAEIYSKLDTDKYYDGDFGGDDTIEYVRGNHQRDENHLYADDGYHCTAYGYSVIPISWQQAELIEVVLEDYSQLGVLWQN